MKTLVPALAILGLLAASGCKASPHHELEAFNDALRRATLHMDNVALAALWEEDGISLLPDTAPLKGKQAILKFIQDVDASIPGASMQQFELQCFDAIVAGDWASEWCHEHQIVKLPGDKPVFEGAGNLLLILHKSAAGTWRLKREMWNHQ